MSRYSNFFGDYHPVVVFIYYMSIFVLLITITHPAFLLVSLFVLLLYSLLLDGIKSLLKSLVYMIPMVLFIAVINPFFNHYGETPLFYMNNRPVTLEALLFGVFTGVLIIGLIFLFKSFSRCIDSHRFIYLFGKILPTISLMITMVMRFMPYLKRKLSAISQTQATLGVSVNEGRIKKRLQSGANILSILISVSLEGTIDTADSMKARGYQLKGKTHYNTFVYTSRDFVLLVSTVILDIFFAIVVIRGSYAFEFYPRLTEVSFNSITILILVVNCLFMGLPIIVNIVEEVRWKLSRRKI
ncbi:energy-coupling factor transporter transmembrane component T [Parasporobacterium paucivorans]|uniref:Energy-coupling factor transport system permease protein n=1 Tax=Parasporobacterium paucivorans DSM 15970 TaxID=1122934 RepID=A0A1M6DIZ3_9FIRM|nr:energy-coupling factor transporter transmembrane component T [Parasporobacterium paucivorans]SHI73317.1 energy-coupling factor transport system permease protein [Parasporobacterium paucivorans DSM 15970]